MIMNRVIFRGLKIISLNVNSIITNSRRANLLGFLVRHKPDIVLLCETKLNKYHNLSFAEYSLYRNDRVNATQGGGTAILVKRGIAFRKVEHFDIQSFSCLETTVISLDLGNHKFLKVISAYATENSIRNFSDEFTRLFQILRLNDLDNYYILAGDFNAKHTSWLNSYNNTRGNFIRRFIDDNQFDFKFKFYSSVTPSFPRGNSYLDVGFIDVRLEVETITSRTNTIPVLPYDSDHSAILMNVCLPNDSVFSLLTEEGPYRYNFNKTDWSRFKRIAAAECRQQFQNSTIPNNRNLSNLEIDAYIDKLNLVISNSIESSVPKFKNKNSMECYLTPMIRRLLKYKSFLISRVNYFYRNFNYVNNAELIRLKALLRNVKELLKQQFRNSINDFWKKKLLAIQKRNSKSMFPQINRIFRPKGKVSIPALKVPDSDVGRVLLESAGIDTSEIFRSNNEFVVNNNVKKLSIIGSHFEKVHSAIVDNSANTYAIREEILCFQERNLELNTILQFSDNIKSDSFDNQQADNYFVTFQNLLEIFRKLSNKKSSGLDNIPNIALKHLPQTVIRHYCVLYNNLLNNLYFPDCWKIARVFPIKKKGKDASVPTNYRPISLLSNVGKIFEILISKAILHICELKRLIPENQFGFRRHHSTVHAITKLVSDVNWNLVGKQSTGGCLVDLEKAFDTVWTDGLITKLIRYEFPDYLIKIISNMIRQRKFVVTDGADTTAGTFCIENGLQQGTVNSPILFSVFLSDFLKDREGTVAFADDIILYSHGSRVAAIQSNLQQKFNQLQKFCADWKLKINFSKCEVILFRTVLSQANRDLRKNWKNLSIFSHVSNGNVQLRSSTGVRYLGVWLDHFLYFNEHIKVQLDKARAAFMSLKRLFYSTHLTSDVKLICYLTLIRPILTYGCPIWYNISSSYMEKLRVFERKCLRACLGKYRSVESEFLHLISNKIIYDNAGILRIDNYIIKLIRNHFARSADVTENNLVSGPALYYNPLFFKRSLETGHVPPEAFKYLDSLGYIQDRQNVPVFYHAYRRATNKTVVYEPRLNSSVPDAIWRYNMALSTRDCEVQIVSDRFFWLDGGV